MHLHSVLAFFCLGDREGGHPIARGVRLDRYTKKCKPWAANQFRLTAYLAIRVKCNASNFDDG